MQETQHNSTNPTLEQLRELVYGAATSADQAEVRPLREVQAEKSPEDQFDLTEDDSLNPEVWQADETAPSDSEVIQPAREEVLRAGMESMSDRDLIAYFAEITVVQDQVRRRFSENGLTHAA